MEIHQWNHGAKSDGQGHRYSEDHINIDSWDLDAELPDERFLDPNARETMSDELRSVRPPNQRPLAHALGH